MTPAIVRIVSVIPKSPRGSFRKSFTGLNSRATARAPPISNIQPNVFAIFSFYDVR